MNHNCEEGLRTENKILLWNENRGIYTYSMDGNVLIVIRDTWHSLLYTTCLTGRWHHNQKICSGRGIYMCDVRLLYIWLNQFDVCTMVVLPGNIFVFIFSLSLNLTTVKFMFLHYYLFFPILKRNRSNIPNEHEFIFVCFTIRSEQSWAREQKNV